MVLGPPKGQLYLDPRISMSPPPIRHVFAVRGRPVGFRPSRWGGALVAVERGYFPISATGFRSLAGEFGQTEEVDPGEIPHSFLELLVTAQDKARRALLARVSRTPQAGHDPLINFIEAGIPPAEPAPADARG